MNKELPNYVTGAISSHTDKMLQISEVYLIKADFQKGQMADIFSYSCVLYVRAIFRACVQKRVQACVRACVRIKTSAIVCYVLLLTRTRDKSYIFLDITA